MRMFLAWLIVIVVVVIGLLCDPEITGNAVSSKPDLSAEVVTHGVDKDAEEMYIVFKVKNTGDAAIQEGTTITTRMFVRYTAPPVKHEGTQGSISTAEVFLEEVKASYVLPEDLIAGETVLVISPPVPILLSTVRFFEKYKIKNRITIELDYERQISESNEKNNKLMKWYYMQEWTGYEGAVLDVES